MKRPWPTRSSTLSPKIHRYHMLPITCDQLPWRNIDVTSVGGEKFAGTTPNTVRNSLRSSCGSETSNSHAIALRTMIVIVMYGKVRDGMTSRRGIISTIVDCRFQIADLLFDCSDNA